MKKIGLAWQILIGLVFGVIVGAIFFQNPAIEKYIKPFGDIFIHLIKMIVIPIVISSLIVGVASVGDMKKLGRLGGKTLLYFEVITTIAIILGILLANIVQPGAGVDIDNSNIAADQDKASTYVETGKEEANKTLSDTIVHMVPSNIFASLGEGDMIPIIFFSVLFGIGVAAIGDRGKPVLHFFQGTADTMFYITNLIMKLAPYGVFALMADSVSKFGLESLIPLGKLVLTVYGAMLIFILVVLGFVSRFVGVRITHFFKILKSELILAFSTASSETVLPRLMEKMEKFGCPKAITTFVIPTGYSFNLDGSTLYQAIASLFIVQMVGYHLTWQQQLTLMGVLMIASKGIAGVPGVSLVVISVTLGAVGVPSQDIAMGIAYILGIDRLLDMARTAVNVIGNSLAVVVISKWEKQYDTKKGKMYLEEIQQATT